MTPRTPTAVAAVAPWDLETPHFDPAVGILTPHGNEGGRGDGTSRYYGDSWARPASDRFDGCGNVRV